jgi:superfamily II DNA or RNA helicase
MKAVWKDIRDTIRYLNKCIKLSTDRADLYIRSSASPDNLEVFRDAVAVEPPASLLLPREPARSGDDARRFYASKQNLCYFVEHAPAHLRQQQCRALIEIKQDFDDCEPISSDERDKAARVQALLDRCLAAFKLDIRSTYYCTELSTFSNTRSYLTAIRRVCGSNELDRAIIAVLPTGAGKTGIISLAGFTCNARRVLVVVPNLEILKGMSQNFCRHSGGRGTFFEKCGLNEGREKRFPTGEHGLPKTVVISANPNAEGLLSNGGQCCAVREPADAIALDPDVVVTNIHQLSSEKLRAFPIDYFDLVIFDEAHHGAATNYRYVQQYFRSSYQLLLTATAFRSDRAGLVSLHGDDSRYNGSHTTAAEAVARRIITNIIFESVPVESFDIVDTVTKQVIQHVAGQEQILELAVKNMIQRAAVYSEAVRASIMLTAMRRLRLLREQDGNRRLHYIIAAAPTIEDAEEIAQQWRALPEAHGLKVETVHSTHPKRDKIMKALREGKVDVIVQVNVLGEGFDLPTLSVACAFKVFRSIGPFMQFVGRVMRVQSGGDPDEIQRAYFVAHPCMRYDKHFHVFTEERQDNKQELKAKGSVANIDIVNHVMAAHPPDDTLRAFADESAELMDRDYAGPFRQVFFT